MKVLFAVSNENISESIVKKYQKQYKEIISYKNVYYFNAILKEIQKDKSYDRIVISEDLEPFSSNNYDQIDKFLFEKLDSISDEATNNMRNDTPIIFLCSDRRTKGEAFLVKMFSIGIYNAVIGQDRSVDEICKLIKVPRTKKEAKIYYQIEAEDASYKPENENDVSEVEIRNILSHYKKLGKDEEAFVKSFDNIASQYNDIQLKVIASFLPLNVKAVLEERSAKYQKIITSGGKTGIASGRVAKVAQPEPKSGIKINFIDNKEGRNTLKGPVIVPSAVNTKNVKKFNTSTEAKEKEELTIQKPPQVDWEAEKETVPVENTTPKRRGRPRKNPLPEESIPVETATPKRRGRPRKNPLPEEVVQKEEVVEQDAINLFDLSEEEEQDKITKIPENDYAAILPGLEDEDFEEVEEITPQSSYSPNVEKVESRPSYEEYAGQKNNIRQDILQTNYQPNGNLENLLTREKKLVCFVGTSKNGTSFLINNVAQTASSIGINTAILDATKNRNAYYIYTQNEEALRQTAAASIPTLRQGRAQGIKVNKNLSVYTSIPEEDVGMEQYGEILATLVQNHSLVLIDCDFDTNLGYFAQAQEIYLVQSMDVLTIQPLTAFLRELKTKNILLEDKIRIVVNKELKVRSLTVKTVIGGMSYYNDPAMSFMTELFNRETVKYCTIPFEEQTYSKYLEGLVNCEISLSGYSKLFMQKLKELTNMVYPLIGSKQEYKPVNSYGNTKFSSDMNHTLNQMKRNY